MNLIVRPAVIGDAAAIAEIYNIEVEGAETNYASQRETVESRAGWISGLKEKGFPVLVAEDVEGQVVGFGALTPFHPLAGYRFTVTGSLYVHANCRGKGVGKILAESLLKAAKKRDVHSIIAGINSNNEASIQLHRSMGFQQVGHFKEIGFKNGKWHDDLCFQLILPKSS